MRGQTPMLEFMGLFGVSTGECARFVRLFERSDPGLTGAIDVPFFFASLHLDYNALAAAAFGLFEPEATAGADVDATGRSLAKLRLKYDEFFVCLCA